MSDIAIARAAKLAPITEIAKQLSLEAGHLELYGDYKAKIKITNLPGLETQEKLILVSAISPTPPGEGKTTTSIGLSDALNVIGEQSVVVLREPSLGPIFGMKGGATGGGHAQVVPMEDINLHFTGDFSAIEKANNLLAAVIDNNIQCKNRSLQIDPRTVAWRRVLDMNDRALRNIVVGLGGKSGGIPRETGFDITAASEVMAILCLASSIQDLKERMGNIFVGKTFAGEPVFARDLQVEGAMAVLLKDAIKPNLVQTLGGFPAIIHGGPFANIAQGTNSILATKAGLALSDYVVTEAGFGFDLGGEKFLDIKCVSAGLHPAAAVLVATVRALKYHGGVSLSELEKPNLEGLKEGLCNLDKHLENMQKFGLDPVVAINHFKTDTADEVRIIQEFCETKQVSCAISKAWEQGGEGATALAQMVVDKANKSNTFRPLYDWNWPIEDKINTVAKEIYGATLVTYAAQAKGDLANIKSLGLTHLPICMAKTQKSLSDNPKLLGKPTDFELMVRQIELAAGAGFIIPITGNIMRMPGLPSIPASEQMDIDASGQITGLF
ncbi:MAG: formate--tetrahydrofolate ligase [Saprospiraceae bacterium]|nr:formate--tetrahydrofolate ligase [Saprospiraceae bacterium]